MSKDVRKKLLFVLLAIAVMLVIGFVQKPCPAPHGSISVYSV